MNRRFAAAAFLPALGLAGVACADSQAAVSSTFSPASPYWMWATLVVGVALLVSIVLLLRVRDRHRLLEQAMDRTSDAAFIMSGKDFVYANEAACLSLGYGRDELLRMDVFDIDPDFKPAMLEKLRQKSLDGGRVIFETRHRRRDGSIFPVEITATHFFHKNKSLSICMVRDIAERRHMEVELTDARDFLNKIIDGIADPIFVKDREHRWILLNEAFCKMIGHSREALIGKSDYDFFSREQADVFWEKDELVFSSGESNINEEAFTDANGVTHYIHTRKATLVSQKGETLLAGVIRDISERRRIEDALRASEEKIRGLYELSPLGIALTDMQGRYIEFNEAFRAICGYPEDELMTLDYWTLTPEKYKADEAEQLDSLARSGRYGPYEKEYRRKDGTLVPIHLNGVLVTGKDGKQYIWSIVEDITERQQAQRELAESRAQLRGLVVQREMAREEERKYIAREIHDELGQILTGLKMSISVIGQDWPTAAAPVSGYIKESMALTETAIGVVRNLSAAIRPVELDMGIAAALRWQASRFDTFAGISCEVRIEDEDIALDEADAVAVFRIVQESLTNVVKHARASKVSIGLAREGEGYRLEIADDGCGFDTGIRKRGAFGLVGMRERVLMLGGVLAIDSDEGGTRVVVRFPERGGEKSND